MVETGKASSLPETRYIVKWLNSYSNGLWSLPATR
jgi:hypothetical protein